MSEEIEKQDISSEKVERDENGRILPGQQSLNPEGRPPGSFSIKTKIIKRLEENPDELKAIIEYLMEHERALLFQMIDGRPPQKTDITSAGKQIPILGGITQIKEEREDE